MIDYSPLFDTMKRKGITSYKLIKTYNIDSHTLNALKHNKSITMNTLESLCHALDCEPNDIVRFI